MNSHILFNEAVIFVVSPYCRAKEMVQLSLLCKAIHRRVVNSCLAQFREIFETKLDDPERHHPTSSSNLFRLLELVRNHTSSRANRSVFNFACLSGYIEFVEQRLRGVSIQKRRSLLSGHTDTEPGPYLLAAASGQFKILEILIRYDVAPFVWLQTGDLLLLNAVRACIPGSIKLLLALPHRISMKPPPLFFALTKTTRKPIHNRIVCLGLLARSIVESIDMFRKNHDSADRPAIETEFATEYLYTIRECISNGYPIEELCTLLDPLSLFPEAVEWIRSRTSIDKDSRFYFWSSLVDAITAHRPDCIHPLVNSGLCRVEDTAHETRKSALFVAAETGDIECVKILLSLGASVSTTSCSDRNALHAAIEHDQITVVELLTQYCTIPDMTHANRKGVTPIDAAENRGRTRIIQAMLTAYRRNIGTGAAPDSRLTKLLEQRAKTR